MKRDICRADLWGHSHSSYIQEWEASQDFYAKLPTSLRAIIQLRMQKTHTFPSQVYTELHCFIWKRRSPEEPPGHPGKFLHCKVQQPWQNKHDGRRTLSHWLNSQQKKTCWKKSLHQILLLWKQRTDHICKELWKGMQVTKHSCSSSHAMVMWLDKHNLCYSSLISLNWSF